MALDTSGAVFAWGSNIYGQIGDGTTMPRLTPVRVKLPAGVKVTALREGGQFTLALTTKGQVLAWGDNFDGELGDGTGLNRALPVRVQLPKGVTVTAISAGADSALALTRSGRVLSWGANLVGQLGTGTTPAFRFVPGYVRIPRHTKITSIAAGNGTGYAVTSAGGCWPGAITPTAGSATALRKSAGRRSRSTCPRASRWRRPRPAGSTRWP